MSPKCGKCEELFSTGDVTIKCAACKTPFHTTCVRGLTKAKSRSWKCEGCSEEASSVSSLEKDSNEDRTWFLSALEDIKTKINSNTDEKVSAIQQQLTDFKTQLDSIVQRTDSVETSQEHLQQRCIQIEKENARLHDELRATRIQLADIEQYTRVNNLEITGIPVTAEEDIYTCLEILAKVIDVTYIRMDISIAHRLRLFSKNLDHPPIIVQFTSRTAKDAWLSAARRKKLIETREIAPTLRPGKVYINEHLTLLNKTILGRARRLQKAGKLYYAGYVNGKILIKTSEKAAAIRVQQKVDLDQFDDQPDDNQ